MSHRQPVSRPQLLDEASREHEEFRLRLDKEKIIELETIHAKRDMAAAKRFFDKAIGAKVLSH